MKRKDTNSRNKWFWKELDHYLETKQLKQTKQRQTVIEVFLESQNHVDAEGLLDNIKSKGFNIGLATVYRTLNLLREAGIVEQRSFADGRTLYEIAHPDEHHDHLVCLKCGKVVEFENEQIERLQEEIAESHGFTLISHRLDLFGHCGNCRKLTS